MKMINFGYEESLLPFTPQDPVPRAPETGRVGGIPVGFDGRPVLSWIDEGTLGQVDDPCASINAQIALLTNALNELKIDAQNAAAAGDEEALQQIAAAQATVNAQLSSLKSQLPGCKALTPGCTTADGTPSPECPPGQVCVGGKCVTPAPAPPPPCSSTNPCPSGQKCVAGQCVPVTAEAKPKSRSWLLLAVGGLAAGYFALKGA